MNTPDDEAYFAAKRAIDQILAAITERRDAGDFETMAELFARSSFRTEYPESAEGHGTQRGAAEIAEGFRAMCRLYDGLPLTKYVNTNHQYDIDLATGTAQVRSYFVVFQAVEAVLALQPISAGRYVDEFRRDGGRWHIIERTIYADMSGDRWHHLAIDPVDYGHQFSLGH